MILIATFLLLAAAEGKIYDRCELARELKFVHNAADHQLATWVCIAEHESQYNTSIVGHQNGDGSGDHGIFQISDKFWCSPPGKGFACGVTCAELEDDNITDDFQCAQRIYKEHKQLSGDGFNAWAVYKPHCKGLKADKYIKDCFNDSEGKQPFSSPPSGFAHGFFDTAAGRANKGGLVSAVEPAFDPFLNPAPPSVIQSTENPNLNSFSTFFPNRFKSTLDPSGDLFFTPPTTSTFRPILSQTSTFATPTTRSQTRNLILFNPTVRTTTTVAPTLSSRASVFQFGNTGRTAASVAPTLSSSVFQFGNTRRTTASLTPTLSSSIFQLGNTGRATASVAPTLSSRSSIFQFGNTGRTSVVPTGAGSPIFQLGNTFTSSTPGYQTSTVSQAAPVFIINGVKWY